MEQRRYGLAVAIIGLAVGSAACGGGSGDDTSADDDAGSDAAVDAEIDPATALVGAWERLPRSKDTDGATVLEFFADGTLTSTEPGDAPESATWSLVDGELRIEYPPFESEPDIDGGDYVIAGGHLMFPALFPVGAVDGLVGTWSGHHQAQSPGTSVLTLAAEQACTYVVTLDTGEVVRDESLSWGVVDDTEIWVANETGGWTFRVIAGVAVGGDLYRRLD